MKSPSKILVIQTAFIGDVILATPVLESLHRQYPDADLYMLVRKGNEVLLENHPFVTTLIWDKSGGLPRKWSKLLSLAGKLRGMKFDRVYNLHRFSSSGLLTWLSGAKQRIGFDKNPLSRFFTRRVSHQLPFPSSQGIPYEDQAYLHEVQRNLLLVSDEVVPYPAAALRPKLYPGEAAKQKAATILKDAKRAWVLAPTSVWFTKQWPAERWSELLDGLPDDVTAYLVGAPADKATVDKITAGKERAVNLCGELNLLETAALMSQVEQVFTNDSAPMHLASAVNTPTTAIYCATRPSFGFGPLAEGSWVVEADQGCCSKSIHGDKACPSGNFACGFGLSAEEVLSTAASSTWLSDFKKATETLRQGGVLLHETETICGLACDATNEAAIERIYAIKQRDPSKPLLVLCADEEMREQYFEVLSEQQRKQLRGLEKENAGEAMTIIFPKARGLASNCLPENGSIGIRIPQLSSLRRLIRAAGVPIASTSANLSGEPAVSNLAEADERLLSQVGATLTLPKGESPIGTPSKIYLLEETGVKRLR